MRRVMVTGGAGFIGSHLARRLEREGYHVEVVDNLSTGSRHNLSPEIPLHELDLSRPDSLSRLPEGPWEAILHLAGQSSGEKSFDDPAYDMAANALSTVALAQWGLQRGVKRLVYASSMGVYGDPAHCPVSEDTEPWPRSHYGASKWAAERALEVFQARGLSTCCLRMFSVYGPGQNLADLRQGMVSIYLAQLLSGRPVEVKGSLERCRDLVYVEDVVEAWRLALESTVQGVFNVGTGVPTRVQDLLAALARLCQRPLEVRSLPSTPGDQFAVWADPQKIARELGWRPQVALEEGLALTVEWARSPREVA